MNPNENPKTILKLLEKLDSHKVNYKLIKHRAEITLEEISIFTGPILKAYFRKDIKADKTIVCGIVGDS